MEIRSRSNSSSLPFHTLRRDLGGTGLTQIQVLKEGKGEATVKDTVSDRSQIVISPLLEESFSSISEPLGRPTVVSPVPTLPTYVPASIYDKRLEFLNRGGIITGLLTAILIISTMIGYIPSATGISASAALSSIFSAFVIERWRLSRK